MKITIMRGLHDSSMVEPVANEARGADALLIESVGTKQEKLAYMRFLNDMSNSPEFADSFTGSEPEIVFNDFKHIAWELRKTGIQFVLVDKTTDDPTALAAEYTLFTDADFANILKSGDLTAFYKAIQTHLQTIMINIKDRDQLVCRQVLQYVDHRKKLKIATNRIVLAQGYNHTVKPLLQQQLPEEVIEEKFYGFTDSNSFNDDPELQLLHQCNKQADPTLPVPLEELQEDIDRLLLSAILTAHSPLANELVEATQEPLNMHANSLRESPIVVERRRHFIDLASKSAEEVHQHLVAELAKLQGTQ
jgi:hypothetical protein